MMRRFAKNFGRKAQLVPLVVLGILSGCGGGGKPSVSGSSTEVTVHGTVSYKGKPVTEGTIKFDPANTSRRDAKATSAPIGSDGAYKVTTLLGENRVSFEIPSLFKQDPMLAPFTVIYDAPAGDSPFDIKLGETP